LASLAERHAAKQSLSSRCIVSSCKTNTVHIFSLNFQHRQHSAILCVASGRGRGDNH